MKFIKEINIKLNSIPIVA